ncbi:hypothetical protein D3C86_1815110 [compost metagenome]
MCQNIAIEFIQFYASAGGFQLDLAFQFTGVNTSTAGMEVDILTAMRHIDTATRSTATDYPVQVVDFEATSAGGEILFAGQ